ncbi:MAG: hypothetical protein ACP6IY_11075 [Promethearchaeia archaeon]
MVNFYFIDTGIIIGYCNEYDYLHEVSTAFFNEKNSRNCILLFSVHEEFIKKIYKELNEFEIRVSSLIQIYNGISLRRLRDKLSRKTNFYRENFLRLFLMWFYNKGITFIEKKDLDLMINDCRKIFLDEFDSLTQNWIKSPPKKNQMTIFSDNDYISYKNSLLSIPIDDYDKRHLCLAAYYVTKKNKERNHNHTYYFYSDDGKWFNYNLDNILNVRNLEILRIPKKKSKSLLFNPFSNSFDIQKWNYLPDGR